MPLCLLLSFPGKDKKVPCFPRRLSTKLHFAITKVAKTSEGWKNHKLRSVTGQFGFSLLFLEILNFFPFTCTVCTCVRTFLGQGGFVI